MPATKASLFSIGTIDPPTMPLGLKPCCAVCKTNSSSMWKKGSQGEILCNNCTGKSSGGGPAGPSIISSIQPSNGGGKQVSAWVQSSVLHNPTTKVLRAPGSQASTRKRNLTKDLNEWVLTIFGSGASGFCTSTVVDLHGSLFAGSRPQSKQEIHRRSARLRSTKYKAPASEKKVSTKGKGRRHIFKLKNVSGCGGGIYCSV